MKMSSSGFAPRRRQGGFIQGAILFALVIIAVVVAAFSLANRDSQSSADTEQARVNASFVLKVGNDLQTGVNRAIADGLNPAGLTTTGVLFTDASSSGSSVNLFDNTLKYVVRPQFPPTALIASATQPFAGSDGNGKGATASWAAKAVTGAGGSLQEAIIQIPGLKADVCKRINVTANNTLVTATLPGSLTATGIETWREGCFGAGDATGHTYFRVVATDAIAPTT